MYKKITKSMETSMMIGNWFASGYRNIDDPIKNSVQKKVSLKFQLFKEKVLEAYNKF